MSYEVLRSQAHQYGILQEVRKSTLNQYRSARVSKEHMDELTRVAKLAEREAQLKMIREYRSTVGPNVLAWQKSESGIGEILVARLLGQIGDPMIARPYRWEGTGRGARKLVACEPSVRTVSQLWGYAGHGDAGRRLFSGISVDQLAARGNPNAKMLTWNIAKGAMMTGTRYLCADGGSFVKSVVPHIDADEDDSETVEVCRDCGREKEVHVRTATTRYGQIYDDRRSVTRDRLHAIPCVRCGPKGKPAPVDSPWSKAHQHADATRILGKQILLDLWLAAKADMGEVPVADAPSSRKERAKTVTEPTKVAPAPSSVRLCGCGVALVKKPGPGRWPLKCPQCKGQ